MKYTHKDYKVKNYKKTKYKTDKVTGLLGHSQSYMRGQPKQENTVGYCSNTQHKGKLSISMMKQHKCLTKQCPYFKKNESNIYWKERDIKKLTVKILKYMNQNRIDYIIIDGHYFLKPKRNKLEDLLIKFNICDFTQVSFK